jgi:hypothetical protein
MFIASTSNNPDRMATRYIADGAYMRAI